MRRFFISIVLVCLISVPLSGCKSSQSPIFFTSPSSPYPDVPVPVSFTLVEQSNSGASSVAGRRSVSMLYQSKDAIEPVAVFFREQLPKRQWELRSQDQGSGRVVLKFSKGDEDLQIELWSASNIRTNAMMRIAPGARGSSTSR